MGADFLSDFTETLGEVVRPRLETWGAAELAGQISLERPALREHGDLAANVAMVAARKAKRSPRELAAELVADMEASPHLAGVVDSIQIAGPGFINFFLQGSALAAALAGALGHGLDFGAGTELEPQKILLEFVSANPTGPLHAGHARYAAFGDSLKRILSFTGNDVTTEFYINDYGSQMDNFGRTLAARYGQQLGRDVPFPEDGYQGEYPRHVAALIAGEIGDSKLPLVDPVLEPDAVEFFKQRGCEIVLAEIRRLLESFRVRFDNWYSESGLYASGAARNAMDELRAAGEVVEREGAVWLLTSKYGDDKDRVLIRETGAPTYFASDIAYHRDKLARGYDRLINIWGADHHGYVPRMKAAFEALAHDPERLEIIIGQLVNIVEMGERRQMSKRAGTMVTLEELIDSIGVDAARFFLVDRSHDSTLDLDLEQARLQSEENPVYYVQYAHARISSILKKAEAEGVAPAGGGYTSLEPQERELVLKILEFPQVLLFAGRSREPHRLTVYGRDLAAAFHVFYHNCPVIKAAPEVAAFRLDLCRATRNTIKRSLDLVGVSAPDTM